MAGVSKKHPKTPFAKRLKIIQGELNNFDFEKKCSLTNSSLSKYYDGAEPKLTAIQSIILATGCNADWLITGRGEPFAEANS